MLGASLGSRVELYAAIRRDARREDLGIRELAARHGVHRRTVRQALASPIPPPRKPRSFPAPGLDAVNTVICARPSLHLATNGTPRGGCWPGWSTTISLRCRIPRYATTWAGADPRSPRK